MKALQSITEYEIIKAAHDYLLMQWDTERAKVDRMAAQGEDAPIATYRRDKYRKQLNEIETLLQNMEDA